MRAYEILETYKGTDLVGVDFAPLYACAAEAAAKQHKRAHFVIADGYVTADDGTGIVHIAPAFGEDDARVGREHALQADREGDGRGCDQRGSRGTEGSVRT